MLTYIKEWIKDCNSTTKEMNEMGYFTISTWFGSYTYVDKEMYKEYHDIDGNLVATQRLGEDF